MHSDDMEDVSEARGGDIVAMFGVDCASGDTFTDGSVKYTMTSMNVPEPVMSLAIVPANRESTQNVSRLCSFLAVSSRLAAILKVRKTFTSRH
jgi:elongation factor G